MRTKRFNISPRTTPVFKFEAQSLEDKHIKFEPQTPEQQMLQMQHHAQIPHLPSYPPRTPSPAYSSGKGKGREI
jgi:hypothetical protein